VGEWGSKWGSSHYFKNLIRYNNKIYMNKLKQILADLEKMRIKYNSNDKELNLLCDGYAFDFYKKLSILEEEVKEQIKDLDIMLTN